MRISGISRRALPVVIGVFAVLSMSAASYGDGPPPPVYFNVGDSTGSISQADDENGSVQVKTIIECDGFQVVFQLDKLWKQPSDTTADLDGQVFIQLDSPVGDVAGPTRITTILMPSAQAAGIEYFDIIIIAEKLVNDSSVVWKDFHISVDLVSGAGGGGEVTLGGTAIPGTRLPQVQLVNGQMDFFGGEWDNDGQADFLFQSAPNDPVKIHIKLGERPLIINIKEWPTVPEPTTLALLGMGFAGVLLRRKKRS